MVSGPTDPDKNWMVVGRYSTSFVWRNLTQAPEGNSTDFPISSDLDDEPVLVAFVHGRDLNYRRRSGVLLMPIPANPALQLTANPLRGLSAAELARSFPRLKGGFGKNIAITTILLSLSMSTYGIELEDLAPTQRDLERSADRAEQERGQRELERQRERDRVRSDAERQIDKIPNKVQVRPIYRDGGGGVEIIIPVE